MCACNKSFDPAEDSLYALSCSLNKEFRNVRHDSIRNKLNQLIKRLNPGISQTHLSMEYVVGQIDTGDGEPRSARTDIKYVKGVDTFFTDVVIADLAASAYQMAPTLSHLTRDGAASRCEQTKRQHYARVNTPAPLVDRSVISFAIEATGRLGPSILLFLHSLCGTQTFSRSNFLIDVNLICARMAGRMFRTTRDRFQGLHQGVLVSPMHGQSNLISKNFFDTSKYFQLQNL